MYRSVCRKADAKIEQRGYSFDTIMLGSRTKEKNVFRMGVTQIRVSLILQKREML